MTLHYLPITTSPGRPMIDQNVQVRPGSAGPDIRAFDHSAPSVILSFSAERCEGREWTDAHPAMREADLPQRKREVAVGRPIGGPDNGANPSETAPDIGRRDVEIAHSCSTTWLEEVQIREDARQPVFESGWREGKYVDDGDCCVLACRRRFNWRAKHRLTVGGDAASTSSTSSPLSPFSAFLPSRAAWRVSRSLSYAYFVLFLQRSAVRASAAVSRSVCKPTRDLLSRRHPSGTFSPTQTHPLPYLVSRTQAQPQRLPPVYGQFSLWGEHPPGAIFRMRTPTQLCLSCAGPPTRCLYPVLSCVMEQGKSYMLSWHRCVIIAFALSAAAQNDIAMGENFPYPLAAWTEDIESQKLVISAFSALIPGPTTPEVVPQLCQDGWWGVHEWTLFSQPYDPQFPYLAWIQLPRTDRMSILQQDINMEDVSTEGALTGSKMLELRAEWDWSLQVAESIFPEVRGHTAYNSIILPEKAHERLRHCFFQLESGLASWRDIVDAFRHGQRSLLELHAFAEWWKDINQTPDDCRRRQSRNDGAYLRGCTTTDIHVYHAIAQRHVSMFLAVDSIKMAYHLPPNRRVQIIPRFQFCNMYTWSFDFHTKDLWFYPPYVMNPSDFERSARGYGSQLDTLRPSHAYKNTLAKHHRERQKLEKLAAQPPGPSNLEIKDFHRIAQRAERPTYSPRTAMVWERAKIYIDPQRLKTTREIRRYAFPPYTMLWAGKESRQQTSYFHFLALREELAVRLRRGQGPLTFQEWKEILGDSYWKKCWPDFKAGITYDPEEFWKYGGRLVFGDRANDRVIAGKRCPTLRLDCECPITSSTGNDHGLRTQVIFKVSLANIRDELNQMAACQVKLTGACEGDAESIRLRIEGYIREVECGGYASENWRDRQNWASRLLRMLMMWYNYDVEVGSKVQVGEEGIEALSEEEYYDMERFLLVFYWHSFMDHLCFVLTELLNPGSAIHVFRCERHISSLH
ncbi:hypothetical protein EVG20_g9079 [Dentipellis fragilis]|uniref:Uncharacterized protein n=1 Tax=Dentipellis fragilis TaxID=205917 RepID=A0A4Y9Y5G7_9AGAM|nr:hypothetical protein EVG20_g9079 [Dentipellis fragilis]